MTGRRTIHDVAATARVSIKTVSRVLNEEAGVRPETRLRVREAMTALDYQPSLPARSLAGRRSNLVVLIFENPSANYLSDVQGGAMAKCRDARFRLLIQSCDGLGVAMIDEVLATIQQTHVDGAVITPPLSADRALIAALDARGLPFVRIAPDDLDHGSPVVVIDDAQAAREMTGFLIDSGHRGIGFVAGHPDHHSSRLRLEGFRAALTAGGLDAAAAPVEQGYNDFASGLEAGRRMLGRSLRPSAIFASNDDMAAGVVFAAHEAGLRVPADVSVSGFDDTRLASMVWPPLTTIHQPSYDMAYAATGLLIDLIRDKPAPRSTRLDHTLVKRGSTAGPGAS